MDQSDPEGPAVEANEGGRLITTSRALYNFFKLINQYAYIIIQIDFVIICMSKFY